MERTLEKLLEQTTEVRRNARIVHIVHEAVSAQEADDKVSELEFPTPIARQARLLWHLSYEHPEEFGVVLQESTKVEPDNDPDVRVFPVSYKHSFSVESYGSVVVIPHPNLPPIFWEYTFLDEDGQVIFSTQDPVVINPDPLYARGVECHISVGSRSLPASLKIKISRDAYKIRISFVAENATTGYPSHVETFTWTRNFLIENGSLQGDEWYERITSHSAHGGSEDRVLLRKLSEDESEALREHNLAGSWAMALVLETSMDAPLDDQFIRHISFTLTTIYYVSCDSDLRERIDGEYFVLDKSPRAQLPYRNPGSAHFSAGPFVGHSGVQENKGHSVRTRFSTVEDAIDYISQHTPEHLEGLPTLWHFFGFKRYQTYIYNLNTNEELEKSQQVCRNSGPLVPRFRKKRT